MEVLQLRSEVERLWRWNYMKQTTLEEMERERAHILEQIAKKEAEKLRLAELSATVLRDKQTEIDRQRQALLQRQHELEIFEKMKEDTSQMQNEKMKKKEDKTQETKAMKKAANHEQVTLGLRGQAARLSLLGHEQKGKRSNKKWIHSAPASQNSVWTRVEDRYLVPVRSQTKM
eukprot:g9019.t1